MSSSLNLFSTVLLALDDSPYSKAAVDLLIQIQWPPGTLVHVIALVPGRLPLDSPQEDEAAEIGRWRDWAAARIVATKAMNRLSMRGLATKMDILEGNPVQVVLDYAQQLGANLIVIGTKLLYESSGTTLIPMARDLILSVRCPLLLTRCSANLQSPLNVTFMVNWLSHTLPQTEVSLPFTFSTWARITILGVSEENGAEKSDQLPSLTKNGFLGMLKHFRDDGVQVQNLICRRNKEENIAPILKQLEADLLVIWEDRTPSRNNHKIIFEVIEQGTCSVLILRGEQRRRSLGFF